eukprot:s10785_g1.t1
MAMARRRTSLRLWVLFGLLAALFRSASSGASGSEPPPSKARDAAYLHRQSNFKELLAVEKDLAKAQ